MYRDDLKKRGTSPPTDPHRGLCSQARDTFGLKFKTTALRERVFVSFCVISLNSFHYELNY